MKSYRCFIDQTRIGVWLLPLLLFIFSCENNGSGDPLLAILPAGASEQISSDDEGDGPASGLVTAAVGGTIQLGSTVSLSVSAGPLGEDTKIQIENLNSVPAGASDGFTHFGQAYRFTPAGTEFGPDKPAILTMKYDADALNRQGLNPETLQIYYFDEEQDRYIIVESQVDTIKGEITARLEHFTIYLPLAKSMVPGNNLPTAAMQQTLPNPIRAEAPIYLRATASDFDLGGAVAGVRICYRKLHPVAGAYQCQEAAKESRPNVLNTYAVIVPASFLTAADLGAGNDIEYYVEVTDNLGAVNSSGTQTRNVTRTYTPGTLSINPAFQNMTAGSQRTFTVQGRDNTAATFRLIPESSNSGAHGTEVRNEFDGITYRAESTAVTSLQASFGAENASNSISIFNGGLDRIAILDEHSNPITGTLQIKEGQLSQFDVIGYDAYGNQIFVNPSWTSDANLGPAVDQNGLLYTLDGSGFGTVRAILGGITGTQWIQVIARAWTQIGSYLNTVPGVGAFRPALTMHGSVMYAAFYDSGSPASYVSVKFWNGSSWAPHGGKMNLNPSQSAVNPSIASDGVIPYVSWSENNGSHYLNHVRYWNGVNWVLLGGALNVSSTRSSYYTKLAMDGSTPYVAWTEGQVNDYQVFVKHWNGSAWILNGGNINNDTSRLAGPPSLAISGGVPYVAWAEEDGSSISQINVKYWNGSAWLPLGGVLNVNPAFSAERPVIVFDGTTPYVAWTENDGTTYQIRVKQWDGSSWVSIGGSLNVNTSDLADSPTLAFYNRTPYVAWKESSGGGANQIYVKHWNGSAWIQNGGSMNVFPSYSANSPFLIFNGSTPYIAWEEEEIYVKALQ